jgi:hypothetical protein
LKYLQEEEKGTKKLGKPSFVQWKEKQSGGKPDVRVLWNLEQKF